MQSVDHAACQVSAAADYYTPVSYTHLDVYKRQRTRFSFASACNLLGLEVQDLDEKKSQIAHGETVRETANMVSFMADVIGIRDDMYIGKGHTYQKDFMDAVTEGNKDGILEQRPTLVNLQCDVDHPTQCMADMLHIIHEFGGVENLKGKKLAMTLSLIHI